MSSTYTASTQSGSVSPLTTKGDIYTYDTADARLPVGTNGQVLTANSAEATGLEWISLGLGTMSTQNANAVAITGGTLSGITQLDVDNIRIDGNTISSTDANGNINLTPNGAGVIAGTQLTLTTALDETYGGTAQTTYTTGDLLYASASNTLSKLAIGSRAQFPIVTSAGVPTWKNPSTTVFYEWEFLNGNAPWTTVNANGGSITNASSSGHPGVVQMNTGTNTNGISTFRSTNRADDITFSGGLMRAGFLVHLSALSDGTDTYYAAIGFNDSNNSAQIFSDAIAFRYSSALNSGQWVLHTSIGGVTTSTNTATAVAGNTWYFLEIELNAAANNVEFFVNGVSLGSNTTNIPTTCGMYHSIEKTAGTTSRILTTDYAYFYQELSSARY